MNLVDKVLLGQCAIIESLTVQLNNLGQIEHSRDRSDMNCLANLLDGLIANSDYPIKLALDLPPKVLEALPSAMF